MTPSRCVCTHARPRDTPSTSARCPAPQPSPTPHPQHCTRTRTASASAPSCTATSPARGMVRVLNPSCPNCLTNGACTLSQEHLHVNNCRKRNICPRVSACVLACFRVHSRSPDGQELSSVTPSSRVRSHRRRRMTNSTASETSAALRRPGAYILVLCLPFDWGPGMVTFSTPVHAGALVGLRCQCMCFLTAVHTPWLHTSEQICCHWCLACVAHVCCATLLCEPTLRVSAVRT